MKKKILVHGPVLSRSGYGEMARLALRSLKANEDKYDIFISPTQWGMTGTIAPSSETLWIEKLVKKTQQLLELTKGQIKFDISLQVTIPNEWKKMAEYNVGYTAGIETNSIAPAWLEPSLQMNKIITISEHSKCGFTDTVFSDQTGKTYKVTTPVDVVHFPIKTFENEKPLDLNLTTDFNFLTVAQWGPRKNIEQLLAAFIEEFKNESVGLVLKTNNANDSIIDKCQIEERLSIMLEQVKDKKCKVYLLHGTLTESELNSLYKHPKIKAFVSSTHGEGYGIPMFEAVYNSLPVIATDWSGHLDFLVMPNEQDKPKKMFAAVDYELKPIADQHVWDGVLQKGTLWAYPVHSSLKLKMREVYKDLGRFQNWAKKLAAHNQPIFTKQVIQTSFINALGA
jgi:glycosyltransferase involved in cell wall biosynthesis